MFQKIVHDSLLLWVTIEPVGTLLLFTTLTSRMEAGERRKVAFRAITYAAIILLAAIVAGQIILNAMNIRLISLQLAGGVILFLFGLQMIFGTSVGQGTTETGHDVAVFPLAVPSLVGPESITAVVLLTDNQIHSIPMQAVTALVMLAELGVIWVLLLLAEPLLKIIGKNGAAILERVMGMILTALSVELVMEALGAARWAIPSN